MTSYLTPVDVALRQYDKAIREGKHIGAAYYQLVAEIQRPLREAITSAIDAVEHGRTDDVGAHHILKRAEKMFKCAVCGGYRVIHAQHSAEGDYPSHEWEG